MRIVIQRTTQASVSVNDKIVGSINKGFVILLGVAQGDSHAQADYLINKLINLRIFEDKMGKMNLSAK
jgi:D-tyrosyl-tRNA(Tyr) deacylase